MVGAGLTPTPNRLIRVSLQDSRDHQCIEVCGLRGGSVTNPPLYARGERIVLGFDSANRHLQAWQFDPASRALTPLWHKRDFGCASHMLHFPDSHAVLINDYRRRGEEVVLLDIRNGAELGRVRSGGLMQGVVFPSPGWNRDCYWSSMGRLARIHVV
jgi:hypothetical protein